MPIKYFLYSWGANSHGQLGLGHQNDLTTPKISREFDAIPYLITGGGGHSAILHNNGDLLVCGLNDKGQLGLGNKHNVSEWTKVRTGQFYSLAFGWDFSFAVNEAGNIYGCGSNLHGQMLQSKEIKNISVFTILEKFKDHHFAHISAGLRHAAAIDTNGLIYCWGSNNHGQLGYDDKKFCVEPRKPFLPSKATSVSCGENYTVALLENGELWFWGNGKFICNGQKNVLPQRIYDNDIYLSGILISGWNHVIILKDGKVNSFGRDDYGQLGSVPKECQIRKIACGSHHHLAVTNENMLLSWGWNEHGSCGNGTEVDVMSPYHVKFDGHSVLCGCGAGWSFCIVKSKQ